MSHSATLTHWTRRPLAHAQSTLRAYRVIALAVVVPTLLSALYFGFIASDVYLSESRFIVRSPQKQSAGGLGALLLSSGISGFTRAPDDVYTVHDFMLSRDALFNLDRSLNLKSALSSHHIDRISRFAGLDFDDSFEALHRYYQKQITLTLDTQSSISTLTTRAFSAEQARQMNEQLLEAAEHLVNKLNERGRQDLIRFSASEVADAEHRARDAALALAGYRSKQSVVDPERQTTLQLQQVSKLQDELITTKTQLSQLRAFTPDNPQLPAMQVKAKTLQSEIDSEMAKVTGNGGSLTTKAAEFQRLALERDFADRRLSAALVSLEQARADAQRKQLYLERIVQPSQPDVATEPRRVRAIASTFVLGLIVAGILSIVLAGVREHRD
jgi:capsular polysaccharide transport system permease protein